MAQAKETLQYFNFPGRAEPIRCLCVANDIPFEDFRFGFDVWPGMKPTTPHGSVPVLVVEGKPGAVPQSNAILRYFGKKCGAYPADDYEAACADSVVEGIEELTLCLAPSMRENDVEKKKAMREAFVAKDIPLWGERFQRQYESYGSQAHFCGANLSIADYKVASFYQWLQSGKVDYVDISCLDKFPIFKNCADAVYGQEKVKAFKNLGK